MNAAEAAGLPARVGIASSKLAARVAAGLPDPPVIVPAGEEAAFLAPLPLSSGWPPRWTSPRPWSAGGCARWAISPGCRRRGSPAGSAASAASSTRPPAGSIPGR